MQDNQLPPLPKGVKILQENELPPLPKGIKVINEDVKKKNGTDVFGPIPSKLPSQDYLSQGEKMAQRGFAVAPNTLQEGLSKDLSKGDENTLAGLYNTVVDRVGSFVGGIASSEAMSPATRLIKGISGKFGEALAGTPAISKEGKVAPMKMDIDEKKWREAASGFVEKARSAKSSKEYESRSSQFDVFDGGISMDDIKGMAFQAPAQVVDMAMGALTGGTSFLAQSWNDNSKDLAENPNAAKLTDSQKFAYLYTQSLAQAALEKLSLDKITKNTGLTKKVQQKITSEVIDEFIQKGIKATGKELEDAIINKASKLINKIKNVGIKAATGFITEGGTEGIQQITSDAVKLITNKIAKNEIFNEQSIKDNFLKNAVNSAVMGGVMGGAISGGVSGFSNTNKAIRKQISEMQTPEDLQNIQTQVNEQVELGNITPQEAEAANIKAQEYAQIAAKIPSEIDTEKKYLIIGGIEQRNGLKSDIDKLNTEMEGLDESLQKDKKAQVELLQAKLDQVDDHINTIVSGESPEYKEKDGNYFKIIDGEEVKISKPYYELAKAAEEENNRKENEYEYLDFDLSDNQVVAEETEDVIPADLEEKGELIESTLEAERRRSNGERIFAVTEQDEIPVEVTSIEMLRNYTPDQLIAYKPTEQVKPTESEKSDVEKTLYPTLSGSIPLSEALPNGVYKKISNDLFAYADKGDKIAAIVDKANGNIVSKSFWNAKDGKWQLPNKANLKDDAKRFGINEDVYIKKYQDAVDILNSEVKPTQVKAEEVKPTVEIPDVLPYVIEDREKVEPIIEKIKNNEIINQDDLYEAAQVLEDLQSKTQNESLKNLINPVIDKILSYENQSKTEISTVTQKGAVTRAGVDVGKKTVSKSIGQFEGNKATIKDASGKEIKGYIKSEEGRYSLYNVDGNKVASIGEKQITDRDVVLPSKDVVPNPITLDNNGNVKSITLQLQKVSKELGLVPDKLITIEFKNPEKGLDYAIQLRAEQVGEFSDPEFEEIITQVEKEVPIKLKKEVEKKPVDVVSDDLLSFLGVMPSEVKFSKTTGNPEIIKSPETIQSEVIDQMNQMNLVNQGVDLDLSSTTKEKIDIDELNSRLDYPLKKVDFKDFEGYPFMFTISDQLRTGDVVNPNTGETVKDLKGGIGFNGTKGHENMAWANTTKDEGNGLYAKAQDVYNSNKSLFEKAWANGDLPSGQIPMAVVKMAESSILSNEAVFRAGLQNVETLPKKNRKQAITNVIESLKTKVKTESEALKKGTDEKGKKFEKSTLDAKEKIISQSKNILKVIQENKYTDIVDLLKDIKIFALPERAIIVNQVFYGKPTAAGAKEIDINRSKPKTKVSVDLIGNADPSLIHIGKITDLLTEPSTKNIPSTHITSIVGVKVAEKINGKWVKSGGVLKTDHPNYPYGVEGGSIGVLEQPIHMKDAFGEAYGNVLGIIIKNEAKKASITEKQSFSQGLPVQAGLSNKVFSPAIAKGQLDAVDKLSGFLRQAFPTTTFFTTQEAWDSALEEPNVKKHLKDGDVIYAFTTEGNIYINPNLKTTKATLHETGHIWAGFVKQNNPKLYDKGLELVEGTNELKKAIEQYGDTPLAREEALMELMSSKGDTIVNAAQKAKFKEWLLSLYKYISENFKSLMKLSPKEVENLTLDKFLEGMLADILAGKELTTSKIKGETKFSKESQEDSIRRFIEMQRKKGLTDQEIKAGIVKVADQIGLDRTVIDGLFKKEVEIAPVTYKDLNRIEKRKIINSKFDEIVKELKIEKICQ